MIPDVAIKVAPTFSVKVLLKSNVAEPDEADHVCVVLRHRDASCMSWYSTIASEYCRQNSERIEGD